MVIYKVILGLSGGWKRTFKCNVFSKSNVFWTTCDCRWPRVALWHLTAPSCYGFSWVSNPEPISRVVMRKFWRMRSFTATNVAELIAVCVIWRIHNPYMENKQTDKKCSGEYEKQAIFYNYSLKKDHVIHPKKYLLTSIR